MFATSASCLTASWPWSDMSARWSAHASTIFAGFGSSDAMWTLIPWSSWCLPSSSVDSTTVTLFYMGYLNLPSALRSASSLDYIIPRAKTKFGDGAFSVAGPTVRNSLSESVRSAEALSSFKRKLKTYMFDISF